MNGYLLIMGVFILAIGEILITPRISEYFGNIAPKDKQSQYLGYVNLAWLFGLSGGGIIGGFLYQKLGEKTTLAINYLKNNFGIENVNPSESLLILCEKTNFSQSEVTTFL